MTMGTTNIYNREIYTQPDIVVGRRSIPEAPTATGELAVVPVDLLAPGDSPRLEGYNAEHVARLAESDAPMPPILVERRGMRVIDGMHRLIAAIVSGRETIEVEFFDGSEADAFLRGVQANIGHGLPLTLPDRRAAAKRIIRSHSHLSNRAISEATGLGRTTVATLRQRIERSGPDTESGLRIGIDGRLRPVNSAEGRRRAASYIEEHPQAPLREVARFAGISLGTASDVRRRMLLADTTEPSAGALDESLTMDGSGPQGLAGQIRLVNDGAELSLDSMELGDGRQQEATDAGAAHEAETARPWLKRRRAEGVGVDPGALLTKLLRDPSLRYSDAGRQLLTTLRSNAAISQDRRELVASLPPHCEALVRQLAEHYARMWRELAEELAVPARTAPRADLRVVARPNACA